MDSASIIGEKSQELKEFIDLWNDSDMSIAAFTSGSTGTPKEIQLRKSDMLLSAEATCRFLGLDSGSVLGLVLPVDHIAGRMVVVRALACGGKIYAEHPSSNPLKKIEKDLVIDLLSIVPAQVEGLLESPALGRVRAVFVGGAPLDPVLERRLASVGTLTSYATYGMTETCSNVALRRLGQPVYVANEGITFSTDTRGCLVVESEIMSFGRLVTNDIVRLFDNRHFVWVGRADNVINSGGIKLYPEVIERKLSEVLRPGSYYVTSRPSQRWGRELIVVHECEVNEATRCQAESLLERYERPKAWVRVDHLSRTANGKLRR